MLVRLLLALHMAAFAATVSGCRRVAGEGHPVAVTYAASLTRTMEVLESSFADRNGRMVHGDPRGSVAGAHLIREGLWRRDVYITADPATLPLLGSHDPGWAIAFARSEIVLAYARASRFAAALDSAARGSLPWHRVVLRQGFRLGRTDPALDPKGYRAIFTFRLAERHYQQDGLANRILRGPAGVESVFPEEHLIARVEMGILDAGVFYLAEAKAHELEVIRLPRLLSQRSPEDREALADMHYRTAEGTVFGGSPILYAATIPTNASDAALGAQFIAFLLGDEGRAILARDGFRPELSVIGERERLPPELAARLGF